MTKTAVYIATTNGPVRVELISQENIPRSEVVLSGDFVPLPELTEEYQHFVTGTGPVARAFGPFDPPMFSMELSAEIESGRSWHLAAFIAHGLAAENRLAGRDETPRAVVWATGVMGSDFSVAAEHVAMKIEQSRTLFEETVAAGLALHIVAPSGSLEDREPISRATMHRIDDARDVLRNLEITIGAVGNSEEPTAALIGTSPPPARIRRWRTWVIAGISALALAMVAEIAADWVMTEMRDLSVDEPAVQSTVPAESTERAEKPEKPAESAATNLVVQLEEIRASSEVSCAAVHMAGASGKLVSVRMTGDGVAGETAAAGLCGMRVSLLDVEPSSIERVSIEMTTGGFVGRTGPSFNLAPLSKGEWQLLVPRTFEIPIAYQVRLVTRTGPDISISHMIVP